MSTPLAGLGYFILCILLELLTDHFCTLGLG